MAGAPLTNAIAVAPEILYRDDALVVINKPSGLAAHRGYSSEHGDYVLTRVRDAMQQHVYLAHRLDRATSGAMALLLAPEHVLPVQRAFEAGQVHKRYIALVRGKLEGERLIDYAVPRSEAKDAPRVEARTQIRSLALLEERYTLIEAEPLTGRYHQIRRHMKHLRHPIVGDTTYGDGKQNRYVRERFGLMRLFLHANQLSLPHPVSGKRVAVTAALPAELLEPLRSLGLCSQVLTAMETSHAA